MGLGDRCAECRQVRFAQFAFSSCSVEAMSLGFGTRVDSVVFGGRDNFQILRIIALKTFNKFNSYTCGEIRILAIGLLTTTPPRITKDVDIGRPERKPVKPVSIPTTLGVIIFGTSFV